jgi:acetylglutamate kinase
MTRRVLVKYGGATLADAALRATLAEDLAAAVATGAEIVVIHGGGPQTSALSQRLGLHPTFRAGRRVTDAATLEVAAWTLVGGVATEWLASLLAAGVRAVSTPVASGRLLRARRRPPRLVAGSAEPVDFGEVADPVAVDPSLLEALWTGALVPVLSSLCVDDEGRRLNLNADTAARALAVGLRVDDVISVADVPGVFADLDDPGSHLAELDEREVAARIEDGTVSGGMVAKLEEMVAQLRGGVGTCWIVGAREPRPVSGALTGASGLRTRVRLRGEA